MANTRLRTAFIQLTFRELTVPPAPHFGMEDPDGLYTPAALEEALQQAFRDLGERAKWLLDIKVVLLQDVAE